MRILVFRLRTRKREIVEVGVTVNALGEVVKVELVDGGNAWSWIDELVRAGKVERFYPATGEEAYRLKPESHPVQTFRL